MRSKTSNRDDGTKFKMAPEKEQRSFRAAAIAVVCAALVLGSIGSAFAKSGAEWDADRAYERVKEDLAIIIPGASFAQCGNSAFPAKCEENRKELIEALRVLSRLRYMHFGYESGVQRSGFIRCFQTKFLDVLYCFRENCNVGIKFTETS